MMSRWAMQQNIRDLPEGASGGDLAQAACKSGPYGFNSLFLWFLCG